MNERVNGFGQQYNELLVACAGSFNDHLFSVGFMIKDFVNEQRVGGNFLMQLRVSS